jgi:hypothetical protein
MRTLRFVPFTFICGVHGFAFFVPYLGIFLATVHLLKLNRKRRLALA